MSPAKRTEKKRRNKLYTTGELNRLVDDLIHPSYKKDKVFVLLDGLLHGLLEQNPPETVRKFWKYSLQPMIDQIEAFSDSNKSSKALSEIIASFLTSLSGKRSRHVYKSTRSPKGKKIRTR